MNVCFSVCKHEIISCRGTPSLNPAAYGYSQPINRSKACHYSTLCLIHIHHTKKREAHHLAFSLVTIPLGKAFLDLDPELMCMHMSKDAQEV